MKNRKGILVLCLLCQFCFGQSVTENLIHGKIHAESGNVYGINVVNLVNEKSTLVDANGDFYILAKADDMLVFSSVNFEFNRKLIDADDLKRDMLMIKMIPKMTELEEVIVNKHPEINARALGIIPKNQKTYTPAERGRYSQPKGPLDAIKIMITGKNPARDKALKVERNRMLLSKLEFLFGEKYYSKTLKISPDYIRGFQYYCIEDAGFVKALKVKNKTLTMFLIVGLAEKYKQIIEDEK